jgi:poly-gamma-glutamate synthesis protein (capsule biosynthesis protein)
LAFVGDINLGRHNTDLINKEGDPWIFQACKPIFDEADFVVANLESPVGEGGEEYTKKSVYLKGRPQDLDSLSYAGFGLVTLANNHVLDYGPDVSQQTTDGLDQRGILHTGLVSSSLKPQQPVYVEVQGVTLAFLGYCSVCPGKFEAGKKRPGVEVASSSVMLPEIQKAKKKADFVIVLLHWGTEYYGANPLQQRLAKSLRMGGADLVIGAHPHVLQKIQRMGKTLVAYSLGNFFFDMKYAACQNSCILVVDLQKGKKPQWKAIPVDLSSGRPEPLAEQTQQAMVIQEILKKGYEYHGRRSQEVQIKIPKKSD